MIFKILFIVFILVLIINAKTAKTLTCFLALKTFNSYLQSDFLYYNSRKKL